MKLDLLVIAGQLYRGEYVLKSCTRVAMRSSMLVGALERDSPTISIHSEVKRNPSSYCVSGLSEGGK